MNLAENLHYLRKRDKITQEELADRLGVSRQSVSKWETGEAYPETDKLIILADMFNVTLDALMRTNLTVEEGPQISPTDDFGFASHMNIFSRSMAAGVFLIMLGVSLCVAFAGEATSLKGLVTLMEALSAVSILLAVAGAVFLFVYYGIKHENFKKEHPEVGNIFEENEVKAFNIKFSLAMALLVSGVLVDVIFLVVMSFIIDADATITVNKDSLYSYFVAAFIFVLSFLVGGFVYFGIQHTKYNVSEYNKESRKANIRRSKLNETISSVIMLSATALYLVLGFVWHLWHPGWIVFPVGGIICGIVGAVLNAKNDGE